MTSAMYGRMRIGRCVESDLGYLGCSSDILDLADRKCSGKKTCEIRIPDGDLDKVNTCYKELKVYLEASYRCVRGGSDNTTVTGVDKYMTRQISYMYLICLLMCYYSAHSSPCNIV